MSKSNIEWTDETWNVTSGCTRVSAGCDNCYAVTMTKRLAKIGHTEEKYGGLVNEGKDHFNGKVKTHPEVLEDAFDIPDGKKVFVNSMSDLFHPEVPFKFIDKVFAVMALNPDNIFQVLTKRPERMAEYLNKPETPFNIAKQIDEVRVERLISETEEVIVPVPGFPGYEISNSGKVFSLNGSAICCNCGEEIDSYANKKYCSKKCRQQSHYRRTKKGKPDRFGQEPVQLKPDTGEQGHQRVTLFRDGKRHRLLIHRLMLEVFDRKPKQGEQGRHINGNPECNHIANLEWGSQSDNWEDRIRHGNFRSYSKLSDGEVETIKQSSDSLSELAGRFDVSETQIRNIRNGDQWVTGYPIDWPLSNCWLGTSCENQEAADERIPHLLQCPAAVRFLSCEPLLGPVNFRWKDYAEKAAGLSYREYLERNGGINHYESLKGIHWVIAGGESGHNARPMHPDWVRNLRDQCQQAGTSFFFKQWGKYMPYDLFSAFYTHDDTAYNPLVIDIEGKRRSNHFNLIQQREQGLVEMAAVGKKKAGRILDDREWNQMPEANNA